MKADIHPDYQETDIVCACGAVYHTRSTKRDIKIGICAPAIRFSPANKNLSIPPGAWKNSRVATVAPRPPARARLS